MSKYRIKIIQGSESDKVFQVQVKRWWGWSTTTSVAWLVSSGEFTPCDYIFKTEEECINRCKDWAQKDQNKDVVCYIDL